MCRIYKGIHTTENDYIIVSIYFQNIQGVVNIVRRR